MLRNLSVGILRTYLHYNFVVVLVIDFMALRRPLCFDMNKIMLGEQLILNVEISKEGILCPSFSNYFIELRKTNR